MSRPQLTSVGRPWKEIVKKKAGLVSLAKHEGLIPPERNASDEWEETCDAMCIWVSLGDLDDIALDELFGFHRFLLGGD
ncbi:hypothetical protein D3Y55_26010 [Mesorhizobium sp. DCY119]|nr:hypothetical protein D3Y55_26010 [Mesorhizobium sp. DCY119]